VAGDLGFDFNGWLQMMQTLAQNGPQPLAPPSPMYERVDPQCVQHVGRLDPFYQDSGRLTVAGDLVSVHGRLGETTYHLGDISSRAKDGALSRDKRRRAA
jgi:hypothetical protein